MWLKRVSLRGFRSYTTLQTIDFESDVTILAGRNNVGKSALLTALRAPAAFPVSTPDFTFDFTWHAQRGELEERLRRQSTGSEVATGLLGVATEFEVVASLRPTVDASPLTALGFPSQYLVQGMLGQIQLTEAGISGTSLKVQPFRDAARSPATCWLWWTEGPLNGAQGDAANQAAHSLIGLWELIAQSLSLYYIQPRMPGAAKTRWSPTLGLSSDGANLTNVVATLYTQSRRVLFPLLETFVCDSFPEIKHLDVSFDSDPPQAEIVILYGRDEDLKVPLSLCGTGIEQLITLATAILTATRDQTLLIDEPHAFLHPHAERKLLGFIREHSRHQYIIATHSPVFLTAYPITHTRLLTIGPTGTAVANARSASEILSELGVTASALWSHDAILWVEGPSEEAVCDVVKAESLGASSGNQVLVKQMPVLAFQAAKGARAAHSVVEFSTALSELLSPLKTNYVFLFDADERSDAVKQSIKEATNSRARFLGARELENLLLDPAAIHRVVDGRCEALAIDRPTLQQIEEELRSLVEMTDDQRLYPRTAAAPDPDKVVGSEVLDRIWWTWLKSPYEKVRDGAALASAVLTTTPARLAPIVRLLEELAKETAN